MIIRTFQCHGTVKEVEEWCEKNCTGKFSVLEVASVSWPRVWLLNVTLTEENDCVLFQMRWASKDADLKQTGTGGLPEPAFSLEELQAETHLRDARSYIIGSDHHADSKTNAGFVEEIKQWCADNLAADAVMIEPAGWNDSRIILGIPDDDDRALFLLRWEGRKGPSGSLMVEHVKTFQWAAEVPE